MLRVAGPGVPFLGARNRRACVRDLELDPRVYCRRLLASDDGRLVVEGRQEAASFHSGRCSFVSTPAVAGRPNPLLAVALLFHHGAVVDPGMLPERCVDFPSRLRPVACLVPLTCARASGSSLLALLRRHDDAVFSNLEQVHVIVLLSLRQVVAHRGLHSLPGLVDVGCEPVHVQRLEASRSLLAVELPGIAADHYVAVLAVFALVVDVSSLDVQSLLVLDCLYRLIEVYLLQVCVADLSPLVAVSGEMPGALRVSVASTVFVTVEAMIVIVLAHLVL